MYSCRTCGISCPSDYQYQQHLKGRKHAAMVAGGGGGGGRTGGGGGIGVCFQFQNTGRCSKGKYCTYRHVKKSRKHDEPKSETPGSFCQAVSSSEGVKRDVTPEAKSSSNEIVAEYLLCKTSSDPPGDEIEASPSSGKRNAFGLMMNASRAQSKRKEGKKEESKENSHDFPAPCKNALKRKQNVNLYIQNGLVVWQFGYDTTVISAVKTIRGRQWNKNIGSWVCPLETLPECVALYEYMGRKPDKELKDRAKEIAKSCNGGSASDAIKIIVRFSVNGASASPSDDPQPSFGSADFSFCYDAEVVEALKMVPPSLRNYNPDNKAWTVRLLALPHALEFLGEIGYPAPPKGLKALSEALEALDAMIHNEHGGADKPIVDLESSDGKEGVCVVVPSVAAAEKPQKVKETLKKVVGILENPGNQSVESIDRSDCGKAKRRRLTYAQKQFSRRTKGCDSYDNDFGDDDYYDDFSEDDDDYGFKNNDRNNVFHDDSDYDNFTGIFRNFDPSIYSSYPSRTTQKSSERECDCGRPWKKIGGVHACRYFGRFECRCGNTWTSAYCWKGEAQSCRACDKESMPVMTERLKNNDGSTLCRNTGGAHDSSRCAMCRKLGYNCSLF